MWFDTWGDLARVVMVGAAAYAFLVVALRLSGKRTLGQLNAFDFVVTVSLGSVLATILLSSDVSWAEGATALALLVGLQLVVAWVSARRPRARNVFTSGPVLLLSAGRPLEDRLRSHRLTESELRQAVRMQGIGDLSEVAAVVLETNGKLSVITSDTYGDGSALQDINGAEDLPRH